MTRRRPKSEAVAVSLFPFLAVLLCTMGALIVLLVMLSLQAKDTVEAAVPDPPPAVDEDALARYEALLARADELEQQRAGLYEQLAARKQLLQELEIDGTKLEEELESLDALRGQMRSSENSDVTEEQLKANLTWYENKLFEKETELRKIRQRVAENPVSYAIVPYTGDSGTFRRPLYIECTEEGVILQPEGVILRADDFVVLASNNPLVSAIRETTDYWRTLGRSARGEAYPLLLVRPDGALAFHAAKTALEFWNGDFGYELVDEDWNLEFSQADPELARRQARAIDNARNLLSNLRQGSTGLIAQATRPSFRVATQGSLEPVSPGASGGNSGRGSGQGSGGQSSQTNGGANGGGDSRYGSDNVQDGAQGSAGGSAIGGSATGGTDRYGNPIGSGADGFGFGANNGSLAGAPDQQNGSGLGQQGKSDGLLGSGSQGGGDSLLGGGRGTGERDPNSPMFAQSGTGPNGSGTAGSGTGGGGHEPNQVTGGTVAGQGNDGATNYVGLANPANDAAWRQNGGAASGAMQPGSAGAMQPGTPGAMQPGTLTDSVTSAGTPQTAGGVGQPGDSFGQGGSATQPGSANSATSGGSFSFSSGGSGGGGASGSNEHREENWALPNIGVGEVPVSRMMRVTLDANVLTIYPKDPQWPPEVVRLQPNTTDSLDDFRIAVWREMDRWGIAGRGMFWKPILKFEVTPDGADRYFELKQQMENSGFVLESQRVLPSSSGQPNDNRRQPPNSSGGPRIIRPAELHNQSGNVRR